MMSWLVRASLRQRVLVVALAAALAIVGVRRIPDVAWDVFPEFAPPIVEVQTEAPGLSTDGGREPRHPSARERAQRHPVAEDACGPSRCSASPRWCCSSKRAPTSCGLGSSSRSGSPPRPATLPAVAKPPVILQPLSSTSRATEDRHVVRDAVPDGAHGAREVDRPPAAHGDPRRRQRRHLGRARPPAPGARGPRSPPHASALTLDDVVRAAADAVDRRAPAASSTRPTSASRSVSRSAVTAPEDLAANRRRLPRRSAAPPRRRGTRSSRAPPRPSATP